MSLTLSPHMRIVLVAALAALLLLGGGMFYLSGSAVEPRAEPQAIQPLRARPSTARTGPTGLNPSALVAKTREALRGTTAAAAAVSPVTAPAAPAAKAVSANSVAAAPRAAAAPSRVALRVAEARRAGLPRSVALALGSSDVVVVSLHDPRSPLGELSADEAAAGAVAGGAAFVPVSVAGKDADAFAEKLGMLHDPTLLVYRHPTQLFLRIEGFADRDTVAQAVANAAPGGVRIERTAWAERANAACTRAATQIASLGPLDDRARMLARGPKVIAIGRQTVTRLAAVAPAPGQGAKVAQLLSLYRRGLAAETAVIAALRSGDQAALSASLAETAALTQQADALALELGADVCAQSPAGAS